MRKRQKSTAEKSVRRRVIIKKASIVAAFVAAIEILPIVWHAVRPDK